MYRCSICTTVTEPGQSRLTHQIYKSFPNGVKQIYCELSICPQCKLALDDGVALLDLIKRHKDKRKLDNAAPEYKQGPPRPKFVVNLMARQPEPVQQEQSPSKDKPKDGLTKKQRKEKAKREYLESMVGKIIR